MEELRLKSHCPIHFEADTLTFGIYSKEEIMKLSVVECFNPSSFNQLGHPNDNSLHDLRMGPSKDRDLTKCGTCNQVEDDCRGHIGHICLPIPVINPLYYSVIKQILKMSCFSCKTLNMPDINKEMYKAQIMFLSYGLASQAETVRDLAIEGSAIEDTKSEKQTQIEKLKAYVDEELRTNKKLLKKDVKETDYNRMMYSLMKSYKKETFSKSCIRKCPKCGAVMKRLIRTNCGFIFEGFNPRSNKEDVHLADESISELSDRQKKKDKSVKADSVKFELNASELMDMFRKLYTAEKEVLDVMYPVLQSKSMEHPMDIFFIEVLAVPPPKSRPATILETTLSLHPQTKSLTNVLESVIFMRPILQVINGTPLESLSPESQELLKSLPGETNVLKLTNMWKQLQGRIDNVLDATMNHTRIQQGSWGLKQLIERKEGLFRMNMMGKRVNHAARTVITPDPNIKIDEIGIPLVFAMKLTYPVPVTPFNVRELREYILNGPEKHPGANLIEDEFGRITYLNKQDYNQRVMIANTLLTPTYRNKKSQRPKIVHRQLKNGDILLLNRQPSLHKPSIMAHKARVLKGEKVLRLHYSNCKSYNADFDGDEMNAHFPQSERSRAEAHEICLSSTQYLGPKDGAPLQGLIQDHVIAGVKMTLRGRFFTRTEYLQLVYQALQRTTGRIKTLPPAILKPGFLWSGKQVLSTILINIIPKGKPPPNYSGTAKIRSKLWQNHPKRPWRAGGRPEKNDVLMSESDIVIRGGILCSGILDKSQYGATAYSLTHLLFELYGERPPCDFLSGISVMFTFFLQSIEGFSLGVQDILVKDSANNRRTEVMKNTLNIGNSCAAKGVGAKEEVSAGELKTMMEESHRTSATNPRARMELDAGYKEFLNPATNDINAICVPVGLIKPFPDNNLQLMVNSGAKGSTVNTTQISCLLGQIELEGKRPPVMISGKSLPSFPAYCTLPRAGGYIDGRFMTGIQPQEFFFHCMAGREGLIDTACKTSRSGYLQRCLIKLLEGLVVHHDFTVRDSDNTVVQFQYGEDSMDICKSQYIKPSKLIYISENLDAVYHQQHLLAAKNSSDLKAVKAARKELKNWNKKSTDGPKIRTSPFLELSRQRELEGYDRKEIIDRKEKKEKTGEEKTLFVSRPKTYRKAHKEYRKMSGEERKVLEDSTARRPDPIASRYLAPVHFSSVTEVCDEMINKYAKDNKHIIDADKFKDTMYLKIQQASVNPGEPVGVLAAQSVGEPSTQMTLNTFHFAGRGEMNVTLGIPRLREILMVASANIKTPSMTVPFLASVGERERDWLRLKFNRVTVQDVLEEVQVKEKLVLHPKRVRKVTMRFKFLPHKYYKKDFGIKQSEVLNYMENCFFSHIFLKIMKLVSKEKMESVNVKDDEEEGRSKGNQTGDFSAEALADKAMDDPDDSDNEGENIDDEGTDMAKKGDGEYEKLEDEDEKIKKVAGEDIGDNDDIDDDIKQKVGNQEDEALGDMDFEEEQETVQRDDTLLNDELMSSGAPARRRAKFLEDNYWKESLDFARIVDYKFDTEKELWCDVTMDFDVDSKKLDLVNIIRKSAAQGVLMEVKNIKKAFVIEKDGGKFALQTDGINIEEVHRYDKLLDLNRLNINSIHDMANFYGIEAATKTIVQEVKNVFGVYGIDVDVRHLNLIADYMTIDGTCKPFNRFGISNNPSPLQQITFETAIPFLTAAILEGKQDSLSSPSSQIVTGKHVGVGTGSVHLQYKMAA